MRHVSFQGFAPPFSGMCFIVCKDVLEGSDKETDLDNGKKPQSPSGSCFFQQEDGFGNGQSVDANRRLLFKKAACVGDCVATSRSLANKGKKKSCAWQHTVGLLEGVSFILSL